jgi:hypothetical protein
VVGEARPSSPAEGKVRAALRAALGLYLSGF